MNQPKCEAQPAANRQPPSAPPLDTRPSTLDPRSILNRDFQHPKDGWYMLEPKGEHPNRRSGVLQVIDDQAIASIVNSFNAAADAGKLSHGSSMLVDHEHFRHNEDKETVAYGWLERLQARADGYYGRIRWTGTGQAAVDKGDYRFFSTEYDPSDLTILNGSGKLKRVSPLRLDGLTLTNAPNNKGGRPITNRRTDTMNANSPLDKLVTTIINRQSEGPEALQDFIEGLAGPEVLQGVLNGDYVGHAFHGNQYAAGTGEGGEHNIASHKAAIASSKAKQSGSLESHHAAERAHLHAAKLHEAEGNDEQADYHRSMASFHRQAAFNEAYKYKGATGAASHANSPAAGRAERGAKNREISDATTAPEQPNKGTEMKLVIAQLGLPAESSEETVVAEAKKIMNRNTELATANAKLLDEQCDALMDGHGIKAEDKVRNRLRPLLAGLENREDRLEALTEFGYKPAEPAPARGAQTKLFNRSTNTPSSAKTADGMDNREEQLKAAAIMNRAAKLRQETPTLSLATSVTIAQRELQTAS